MALYEGARAFPGVLPRRRRTPVVRARRRTDGVGLALGVILAAFLLALVYLNQTIHAAASSHDLDLLGRERQRLVQQIQSLEGEMVRYSAEAHLSQGAQ